MTRPEECYQTFSVATLHERLGQPPPLGTSFTFSSACVDIFLHGMLDSASAQFAPRNDCSDAAETARPVSVWLVTMESLSAPTASCQLRLD